MTWYSLKLAGVEVAAGGTAPYKEAFEKAFAAAGGPRTMALFAKSDDEGGTTLYLTPEAGERAPELIEHWGAAPCERPSLVGLNLLVGHNEITYYMP